jgi:hypothetical protein
LFSFFFFLFFYLLLVYLSIPFFTKNPHTKVAVTMEGTANIVNALMPKLALRDNVEVYAPAPAPNTLSGLPVEHLVHITTYLPLSSVALLSLCSKFLWIEFGSAHFELLRKGRRRISPTTYLWPQFFTKHEEQNNSFFCFSKETVKKSYSAIIARSYIGPQSRSLIIRRQSVAITEQLGRIMGMELHSHA